MLRVKDEMSWSILSQRATSSLKNLPTSWMEWLRCLDSTDFLFQDWIVLRLMTRAMLSILRPVPLLSCSWFCGTGVCPILLIHLEWTWNANIFVEQVALIFSRRCRWTKATNDAWSICLGTDQTGGGCEGKDGRECGRLSQTHTVIAYSVTCFGNVSKFSGWMCPVWVVHSKRLRDLVEELELYQYESLVKDADFDLMSQPYIERRFG